MLFVGRFKSVPNIIRPRIKKILGYLDASGTLAAEKSLFSLSVQSRGYAYLHSLWNDSTNARNENLTRFIDGVQYGRSGLPLDLELIISSRSRLHLAQWDAVVDSYLPIDLRAENCLPSEKCHETTNIQPIITFHWVLARAREQSQVDLLSYLGVYQGRWEAVIWLIKAMMEHHTGRDEEKEQVERLTSMLWSNDGQSLDALTTEPIHVEFPGAARISLNSIMKRNKDNNADETMSLGHQSLGQIWQSIGTMILQAADRAPTESKYSLIMIQVFRILGHLHRIGAIPDMIYNYASPADQTVLRRPPTLYLLSKRIMSTLSDVEFDDQWKLEVSKYRALGYEVSDTSVAPKVHEFGPELWLDLILWACVEGGWITEGAWIVGEMEKRKTSRETIWSVISWPEICAVKTPTLDWPSILRFQIDKTRLNQVGGIGIAAGSDCTVDMGTRTISREVIMALMDGLLNLAHDQPTGRAASAVQQSILTLKGLLERGHSSLSTHVLNAIILRMVETCGVDGLNAPGVLQRILDVRPSTARSDAQARDTVPDQLCDVDDTAAVLGLLHKNLYSFAEEGNLRGSLITLKKIQDIVDTMRSQRIAGFVNHCNSDAQESGNGENPVDPDGKADPATFSPQIPTSTLVALLDLITESQFYDIGNWLLRNEDIDGGIVDPELFSNQSLHPALLRFATATADNDLLVKILANIEAPMSAQILHALFRCQIALQKWSTVEELLEHFKKSPDMSWQASDATAIARAILLLEHSQQDTEIEEKLEKAQGLLYKLLCGDYDSKRDPSELPDLSQAKLSNQLSRILKTLPGGVCNSIPGSPRGSSRAQTSISITPNAFNILLDAMVNVHGPLAGKQLWERWCRDPGEKAPRSSPAMAYSDGRPRHVATTPDNDVERVVTPTKYMLRNILRPILRIRQRPRRVEDVNNDINEPSSATNEQTKPTPEPQKNWNTHPPIDNGESTNPSPTRRPLTPQEQEILDWGIDMYRKFGLTVKEINSEIPGAIPRERHQSVQDSFLSI